MLALECEGAEVTTVEALAAGGHLDPLQEAFAGEGMRNGAVANMEALQRAIGQAVATAEQMAGENIERF